MVGKALRLLTLLGEAPGGMTLSELARRAGYPVSTTHRLLASIAREEFAVLDDDRRWSLGLRMFELGQRVLHAKGFAGVATPVLQRLTRQTGEPSLMSVLEGHQQLYVHYVEGTQQVQITGEPGKRGPLHCTSMGKCLIAFAPEQHREELLTELDLPAMGPNTITDRQRFRTEIEQVRAQGYAVSDEEHEAGILAIGVPVLDPGGTAAAALSAAAPAFRSSIEQMHAYLPPLHQAAKELAIGLPRR
ncbi:IclR family transcriptional regulator [Halopolyspora algeriensis]|nr:IclR family transcriptional regulator [Halopolyspora algeriensis]